MDKHHGAGYPTPRILQKMFRCEDWPMGLIPGNLMCGAVFFGG
jgi:hypothetical protein